MKKLLAFLWLLTGLMLTGCLKDYSLREVTYYKPIFKTTAEVRAGIKSDAPLPILYPGKIFYKDGYVYMTESMTGIHIIDVRNPSQPRNIGFIKIPGNVDIAVRENILYADTYTDLVAIDISDPTQVKLRKTVEGVFPDNLWYGYLDSNRVVADWIRVDTTIKEEMYSSWLAMEDRVFASPQAKFSSSGGNSTNGKGGSMARFALRLDRLYTVSYNTLNVFNTSTPENPFYVSKFPFNNGNVETIYPFGDYLFIGSMTGMYLFSANDKDNPTQLGVFDHARVCDPVVGETNYAYVTLRNGSECAGFINQLDVVDVRNMEKPKLVKSYPMFNPHGLAKDGSTLIICEGSEGIKIMDASVADNIKLITEVKGMNAYDVITLGGYALVSALDGLYVVDYTNPANAKVISSLKTVNP